MSHEECTMKSLYAAFLLAAIGSVQVVEAQGPPRSFLLPGHSLVGTMNQELVAGEMRFVMQHDCNLVLYLRGKPSWATNTNRQGSGCVAIMQGDGNLVLLRGSDGKVLWASNTHGHPGAWLMAQSDGNLVIYPPGAPKVGSALWASHTFVQHARSGSAAGTRAPRFAGCAFARTSMKCIGVVQMCQAVWSCGTNAGSMTPKERTDNWGVCGACFGLDF
jgi:hypothetical protein